MKRSKKIIFLSIGGVILFVLLYSAWRTFSPLFSCVNIITGTASSPDDTKKAVVFTVDCGAVGNAAIHLSVINSADAIHDGDLGNAMRIYPDSDNAGSLDSGGFPEIVPQSENSNTLMVHYSNNAQIISEIPEVDGVSLSFATVTPEFAQSNTSGTNP